MAPLCGHCTDPEGRTLFAAGGAGVGTGVGPGVGTGVGASAVVGAGVGADVGAGINIQVVAWALLTDITAPYL